MQRTILITGSTDGIGLEAAKMLAAAGHEVLLHGRSRAKLDAAAQTIAEQSRREGIETFVADLARLDDVKRLVGQIVERSAPLDVLINNAGILKAPEPITASGMDIRFVVNTLAPYLLAKQLMPVMNPDGRIVNVSSAAQASVQPEAMMGRTQVGDMAAYAQSKLALTMWSRQMAEEIGPDGPAVIAVNP
ncbi:MAG: SDR family NAD(P)-dependent oxidoreductase, partial [Pseudomonadota bacterium]